MIDAYEIGIQLLLQEDVSAGLAVINGDLAKVDQAIAATSAELLGMVQTAEVATKAVAAAANGRGGPVAASSEHPDGAVEHVIQDQPAKAAITTPNAIAPVKTVAPEIRSAETSTPAATAADAPVVVKQVLPNQVAREPSVTPSAPVATGIIENVIHEQVANKTPGESKPPAAIAPVQVASQAAHSVETIPLLTREVGAATQEPSRNTTSSAPQVALTASINRVPRLEAPSAPVERLRDQATVGPAARRDRPAAPWSGLEGFGAQAETPRLHERAVAPQSTTQDRAGSGGGTVMLDGRLVGQWLSEHMAREASRPPVGTSFFDPRQTPAWTVSGVL